MQKSVLAVDFGSSYTKLAIRNGFDSSGKLYSPSDDFVACPSIVARVGDSWVTGVQAAALERGGGAKVYVGWKRRLFGDQYDIAALSIAQRFFAALYEQLPPSYRDLPTRFTVPALSRIEDRKTEFLKMLEKAGWQIAESHSLVSEPASNVVGVLTRGTNFTYEPRRVDFQPYDGRTYSAGRMFDPKLVERVRNPDRSGTPRLGGRVRVVVLDVGAYTTDLGLAEFDSSFAREFTDADVRQESVELGVHELDQRFINALTSNKAKVLQDLPVAIWDRRKARIYRGESQMIYGSGERVTIGEEEDDRWALKDVLDDFSGRVVTVLRAFLDSAPEVDALLLTGGGINIPGLRERIANAAESLSVRELLNYANPNEPLETLGQSASASEIESRGVKNRELVRGGSALGGCSVFWK